MRHSSSLIFVLVSCLVLSVGACKKIEEPQKAPVPQEQQQPVEPAATQPVEPPPEPVQQDAAGQRPALPPLFKDIEKRTFQFFWDTTNEVNGMTPDRFPSRPFASIAAIGFALTAYPIGVENGWVSRRQAVRSEEHTSELQSLMRISYAVFCLQNKNIHDTKDH